MTAKHQTRLVPGVYRLREDLPALRNDKRKTRDWRCRPMARGTLFFYQEVTFYPFDDARTYTEQRIWPIGEYEHFGVSPGESYDTRQLEEMLERQEETPSQWLRREHSGTAVAHGTIDKLFEQGKITIEDVQQACREWLEE